MRIPKTRCVEPGCNQLVTSGRCDRHKARGSKNRSGDPFYSRKPWRNFRRERLKHEPVCRACKADGRTRAASVVDHIVPRAIRPDLELDWDNTQSLCVPCHNRKTMTEDRRE
ncbi:HNH endonuclease [Roseiconus lacunae]|uniref:HNH endonuclease n=1 Tax=Roseiconus lacunae TaxID=2605694 RepID=UPI003315473D